MDSIYRQIADYIEERIRRFDHIPEDRKERLGEISDFVRDRVGNGAGASLTFICTHNSRRSQLAQVWAQTAAAYYRVPKVLAYSGGTESTAFHARAVSALRRVGFRVEKTGERGNPLYKVYYSDRRPPVEAFSKLYSLPPNPSRDFCAVLTCADADASCPVVHGAARRISGLRSAQSCQRHPAWGVGAGGDSLGLGASGPVP